jgi:ribulose kinase
MISIKPLHKQRIVSLIKNHIKQLARAANQQALGSEACQNTMYDKYQGSRSYLQDSIAV